MEKYTNIMHSVEKIYNSMDSKYIIAEFNDGLQLIPTLWYNPITNSSIWPNHFKSKFRINKAIMASEMPKDLFEWEELPIKRIFSKADTYEEGMEKLVLVEDTSDIEDMSPDELQEQKKKRRRMRAKKSISSSDEDEVHLNKSTDSARLQTPVKLLSLNSQTGNFILPKKLGIHKSINNDCINVLFERGTSNTVSENDRTVKTEVFTENTRKDVEKSNIDNDIKNCFTDEYKKLILEKLNQILYKLNSLERRMNALEKDAQPSNFEEEDLPLPISTFHELTSFEERLGEVKFKDYVAKKFRLVGGNTAHILMRNILKKTITNNFALNFSWAGKKAKKSFQNLLIVKVITQAVRVTYPSTTDNEISETISRWLAQSAARCQRDSITPFTPVPSVIIKQEEIIDDN